MIIMVSCIAYCMQSLDRNGIVGNVTDIIHSAMPTTKVAPSCRIDLIRKDLAAVVIEKCDV